MLVSFAGFHEFAVASTSSRLESGAGCSPFAKDCGENSRRGRVARGGEHVVSSQTVAVFFSEMTIVATSWQANQLAVHRRRWRVSLISGLDARWMSAEKTDSARSASAGAFSNIRLVHLSLCTLF